MTEILACLLEMFFCAYGQPTQVTSKAIQGQILTWDKVFISTLLSANAASDPSSQRVAFVKGRLGDSHFLEMADIETTRSLVCRRREKKDCEHCEKMSHQEWRSSSSKVGFATLSEGSCQKRSWGHC